MVVDGFRNGSGSPSFTGILFHGDFSFPGNKKCPCSLHGEQGQNGYSAVPPCLPEKSGRSARCQHTGCLVTLAMRQKILCLPAFPPALGGPLYLIAFRPALSSAALSVDALPVLLPPRWFKVCYALYTPFVRGCQEKIFLRRTNVRAARCIAPKAPLIQGSL